MEKADTKNEEDKRMVGETSNDDSKIRSAKLKTKTLL